MYLDSFGMRELPFSYSPNTDFYVVSDSFEYSLKNVEDALVKENSAVFLSGKKGTGKTLLCRKLMENRQTPGETVLLPEPYTSPESKLVSIAIQLGVEQALCSELSVQEYCSELADVLLSKKIRPVVLIIDEAQALDSENLDALLGLIGLMHNGKRIFRPLFSAQPEFLECLADERFDFLRDTLFREYLDVRLSDEVVLRYIAERVRSSGYYSANLFSSPAMRLIAYASRGNPLLINQLCHQALINAVHDRRVSVGLKQAVDSVKKTDGAGYPLIMKPLITSSGSLLFNIVLIVAFVVNMILLIVLI